MPRSSSLFAATPAARCGEPFAVELTGAGDAPLSWSLVSGPAGLVVDAMGHLAWTPPAGSQGPQSAVVRLANGVGAVDGTVDLQVTCATSSTDAGVTPSQRSLGVGCGCASPEAVGSAALLALAAPPSSSPLCCLTSSEVAGGGKHLISGRAVAPTPTRRHRGGSAG